MRSDSVGIFWQDGARVKGGPRTRIMPEIPETGWQKPEYLPNLAGAKSLCIDVETYDPELKQRGPGWARHKGHIVGIAVATDDGFSAYYPIRHTVQPEDNLDPENVLAWAKDQFGRPNQPKLGANLIYDIGWLAEEGIRVEGPFFDVQYAEALLDERARVNLDYLGRRYLGQGKETNLLYQWCSAYYGGSESDQRKNIWRAPPRLVGPYAQGDVTIPFQVVGSQWQQLVQQNLIEVYLMECELIPLMVQMRMAGVTVDIPYMEQMRERLKAKEKELTRSLREMAGFEVNVYASDSLAKLFDKLGIPYGRTKPTKNKPHGSPSFTAPFLESIEHPVGKLIRAIKSTNKLWKVFIENYVLKSHIDGRLYGQFHQLRGAAEGTRSGRFSSTTPNLQNIPFRTKLGKDVRKGFIPDPGHRRWVKADYSQIEYRILAHYAVGPKSEWVREQYRSNPKIDFHGMAHGLILEGTGQDLQRPDVKNMNFGVAYGMGRKTMAKRLGLALAVADQLMNAFHDGAPFLKETMNATMLEAQKMGFITTIMGRRSRFDLWVPGDWDEAQNKPPLPYELAIQRYRNPRRAYLHKALNRRLQGSAADLMKMAMLKCYKAGLFEYTGIPRLTVHDELDFSDPGGQWADQAFAEVYHIMETAIPFRVPILVEAEYGRSWGEVEELKAAA